MLYRTSFALFIATASLSGTGTVSACPDIDGLVDIDCNGRLDIYAFGDSITRGVGDGRKIGYPGRLKDYFPNAHIYNLGIPGEMTSRGRRRAQSYFTRNRPADYIIILEGVNDYFEADPNPFRTRDNLLRIKESANRTSGVPLLGKLTPVRRAFQAPWVSAVNAAISSFTEIDFYSLGRTIIGPDNLHPNARGYDRMARRAAAKLRDESENNRPRDSDGDGVYDYEEQRYGTNKNAADTDGDGVSDGVEIYTARSNPLAVDSDGDGLSDFQEILVLGSNPSDPRPGAPTILSLEAVSNP